MDTEEGIGIGIEQGVTDLSILDIESDFCLKRAEKLDEILKKRDMGLITEFEKEFFGGIVLPVNSYITNARVIKYIYWVVLCFYEYPTLLGFYNRFTDIFNTIAGIRELKSDLEESENFSLFAYACSAESYLQRLLNGRSSWCLSVNPGAYLLERYLEATPNYVETFTHLERINSEITLQERIIMNNRSVEFRK